MAPTPTCAASVCWRGSSAGVRARRRGRSLRPGRSDRRARVVEQDQLADHRAPVERRSTREAWIGAPSPGGASSPTRVVGGVAAVGPRATDASGEDTDSECELQLKELMYNLSARQLSDDPVTNRAALEKDVALAWHVVCAYASDAFHEPTDAYVCSTSARRRRVRSSRTYATRSMYGNASTPRKTKDRRKEETANSRTEPRTWTWTRWTGTTRSSACVGVRWGRRADRLRGRGYSHARAAVARRPLRAGVPARPPTSSAEACDRESPRRS